MKSIAGVLVAAAIIGGGYYAFYGNLGAVRERQCKSWRATSAELTVCRASEEGKTEVVERIKESGRRQIIERFNQGLEKLDGSPKLPVDPKAFEPVTPQWLDAQVGLADLGRQGPHPLAGKRYALRAEITMGEPVQSDGRTQVSYYLTNPDEKSEFVHVTVDVEGLNRFERAFIEEECDSIITRCVGMVYGVISAPYEELPFSEFVLERVDFERAQ